ncbi:hypothetical protein H9Y04_03180 [Streptomyces sp. TRM66268-LWL]|uniref:Uncharacterized protein n=1 Tax=Streptomyces polyasparticus TaxID=2767826 RepID=A0ABR7S8X7_9ACTN|nr:hypothetical protein [Streptomyces polyasparticus]MBC9711574.1 hypothetical protein [Streptomyces polyasparticus]
MTAEPPHRAALFIPEQDAPGTEQPLVEALQGLGLTVQVKAVPVQRSLELLILITLPLHAFLGSLGGKLADDAYRKLKDAIRRTASRPVAVQDTETGVRAHLTPDLGDEAYRQLAALDLNLIRGTLRYDTEARSWRLAEEAEGAEGA